MGNWLVVLNHYVYWIISNLSWQLEKHCDENIYALFVVFSRVGLQFNFKYLHFPQINCNIKDKKKKKMYDTHIVSALHRVYSQVNGS